MFPYRMVTDWSETDACFVARVPALPNCAAHGDTAAEAAAEVQQAAELMIAVLGKKAPPSDHVEEYSGNLRLRLPKSLHASLARRATLEGVSLNQVLVALLAERNATATAITLNLDAAKAHFANAAKVAPRPRARSREDA